MKIVQIIAAPPGTIAKYLVTGGTKRAVVVGYALVEFEQGRRGVRPIIDWGQPYGVPDVLGRDGNVILEM